MSPFSQDLQDRATDAADKIERGYIVPLGIVFLLLFVAAIVVAVVNAGG